MLRKSKISKKSYTVHFLILPEYYKIVSNSILLSGISYVFVVTMRMSIKQNANHQACLVCSEK